MGNLDKENGEWTSLESKETDICQDTRHTMTRGIRLIQDDAGDIAEMFNTWTLPRRRYSIILSIHITIVHYDIK